MVALQNIDEYIEMFCHWLTTDDIFLASTLGLHTVDERRCCE